MLKRVLILPASDEASLFLPFLPLLPKQILLVNIMTDFPEMAIATDSIDSELVEKPQRWNISCIHKFMIIFGLLSSVFDYMTFGMLLFIFHLTSTLLRTGWFVESVISAALIVLVVRTRRPFIKSAPGKYLLVATMAIVVGTLFLPISPVAGLFGLETLPVIFLVFLFAVITLYIISAELIKRFFYKKVKF